MKKLICGLALLVVVGASAISIKSHKSESGVECANGRCLKIKNDGYQCNNCAQKGSYYCWSHNQ